MSVLSIDELKHDVGRAVTPRELLGMPEQNLCIYRGLRETVEAVVALLKDGHTVLSVAIGERNPVIRIERPTGRRVPRGAEKIRTRRNGATVRTYTALVAGCQVEWEERGA